MFALTPRQRHLLLRYIRKSPVLFWGLWGLSLLTAALEAFSVFTVLPLMTSLSGAGGSLSRWCLIFAVLVALRSCALLAHARLSARAGAAAIHEIKTEVLRAYASAPQAAFLEVKGGRLGQLLLRGSYSSGAIVLRLPQLAAEAVRAAVLAGLLLWLNFSMAVWLMLAGAVLWELFSRVLSPRAYAGGHDRSTTETEQSILLNEIQRGAKQLKLAGALEPWLERFTQASRAFSRHCAAEMALQALPKIWFEAGAAAVILGWMLAAVWREPGRAAFGLPLLAVIVVAVGKLMSCLAALGRCRLEILGALPYAEALEDFLESCPRPAPGSGRPCPGLGSGLKLEGVRFAYPDRRELLKGVDLEIPAGRCVMIAGPYGCGKTTLLELLLGLQKPSSGRVLLDARPLQEYSLPSWWERVGVVSQDAFLFHGTVAENILLGRAGYAREAVERTARLVGADAFIAGLPSGYETVVGERGLKLSGGQRQLVLWARALLGDPRVLVLDEPASGLDFEAQAQLASVLRSASAGRTVIVATHQRDWAAWADAAFLLQDGRLGATYRGRAPSSRPSSRPTQSRPSAG